MNNWKVQVKNKKNAKWSTVTVKGRPIVEVLQSKSEYSDDIHTLQPTNTQSLSVTSLLTHELVDLINKSHTEGETKYLNYDSLSQYEVKTEQQKRTFLESLRSSELLQPYTSELSLFRTSWPSRIRYVDFLTIMKQCIIEIPDANKETLKFLIIDLLNDIE